MRTEATEVARVAGWRTCQVRTPPKEELMFLGIFKMGLDSQTLSPASASKA